MNKRLLESVCNLLKVQDELRYCGHGEVGCVQNPSIVYCSGATQSQDRGRRAQDATLDETDVRVSCEGMEPLCSGHRLYVTCL